MTFISWSLDLLTWQSLLLIWGIYISFEVIWSNDVVNFQLYVIKCCQQFWGDPYKFSPHKMKRCVWPHRMYFELMFQLSVVTNPRSGS